jgi:transcriptional regulator with XRE-family HTH domain
VTIAQRLREWRRRKFLTQKELAEQIPVAWQTVSRWEAGESLPRPLAQRRLMEVLGVTPEEMLAALEASEAESKRAA